MLMKIEFDGSRVLVWLTCKESEDKAVEAVLRPRFEKWKAQNYTVAVFRSGKDDQYRLANSLVFRNLWRSAESEAKTGKRIDNEAAC